MRTIRDIRVSHFEGRKLHSRIKLDPSVPNVTAHLKLI